jgi:hypothetical protein
VVPLVFMSDATHLNNFAGDKKAWPVYMTIGNRGVGDGETGSISPATGGLNK